jgi:hypothetical protein
MPGTGLLGLTQEYHIERCVTVKKGGAQRTAAVGGAISLSLAPASPAKSLRVVSQPWQLYTGDGRMAHYYPWVNACDRQDTYPGSPSMLVSVCPAGTSPDQHPTGGLNGPG